MKSFKEIVLSEAVKHKGIMKIIDKMVKDKLLAKSDAPKLYKDVVDEYEEMGDNPDDATRSDVYEIADASGYEVEEED